MSWGRFIATSTAVAAVGACATVVVGMARADSSVPSSAAGGAGGTGAVLAVPAQLPVPVPAARIVQAAAQRRGSALPLHLRTHNATRVITVTAAHSWSTTATLQAWSKAAGGGWNQFGRPVTAHIGADGVGQASESTSRTPAGSFTLTQAFGALSNPGTKLHYFRTTPADWWISQVGNPLYNTHQRCSSGCGFRQGDPNEHLYYETPYYNHAVVIDYNTRNSPTGVRQGAGSAYFLHVYPAGTGPTAGCVAIAPRRLIALMRWLTPGAHPRILIGVR